MERMKKLKETECPRWEEWKKAIKDEIKKQVIESELILIVSFTNKYYK